MTISERRIRQIIREELVAAGLQPAPSVVARIEARKPRSFFSEAAVSHLVDEIVKFRRDGGLLRIDE